MTTVRRSVEQTIARLVLRTLRERASVAGTPAARADAPQALATLIDQTLDQAVDAATLAAFCATAVEHGFGCVVVPLECVAACADLLGGSRVRVGVRLAAADVLDQALDAGASEIELGLPSDLISADERLSAYLGWLAERCCESGIIVKLNLLGNGLAEGEILRICARAATYKVNLVVIPAAMIAAVQRTLHSDMGIKVADVASLEEARQCLAAGAARLGTTLGAELVAAARLG
jgi:deoxyribose-phosphate aldolase